LTPFVKLGSKTEKKGRIGHLSECSGAIKTRCIKMIISLELSESSSRRSKKVKKITNRLKRKSSTKSWLLIKNVFTNESCVPS